jgi:hypothetical protein
LRAFDWDSDTDEQLLQRRFSALDLRIEGTRLEKPIERLHAELERRGIRHRPHCWLSNEWFSPDGIPGIALPFYLAHPRLRRIEKKEMLEVEGGTDRDCMKLLRHEAGHTVSTAYRLHRKKSWRETFGPVSKPYPASYLADPFSRECVLHLPWWYAQAHPAEDFAETFAVWLMPRARWRRLYRGWPALKKLEYVDVLMHEIADTAPPIRSRRQVEPLRELRGTLLQHYRRKQRKYSSESPEFYDRDLKRLFPPDENGEGSEAAQRFLRRYQRRVREVVARWTGAHAYTIDMVLREMVGRARDLKMRHSRADEEALDDFCALVTVQTMKYLRAGHHHIAL